MQSFVVLLLGGVMLEAGWLWILVWSPVLTANYTPAFTREFFSRLPWLQLPLGVESLGRESMVSVLEIGLLATIAGYVLGLFALSRAATTASGWMVLAFAVLFRLTLLLLPGLFSTDIFSYVMYGRIAAVYESNPYVQVPADFPGDPFLSWVFPFWRDAPTVYGPAWTDFSWILAKLTATWANFDQVLAYRLALATMELLAVAVVWRLLRRTRPDAGRPAARVTAFAVFAWNPLVLFDLVGNAHNDAAMILLMLVGMSLAARERPLAGLALTGLSALVKYMTGIAALFWTVGWVTRATSTRERLGRVVQICAIAVALTLALSWPWLQTPAALAPLHQAASGQLVLNSAPDLVALTIADQFVVPSGVDKDAAEADVRFWIRAFTRVIFAAYLVWEVWRLSRSRPRGAQEDLVASTRVAARALLVVPLLVMTWVWSWYFSWPFALAVLLGWGSWVTRLVTLYTLIGLPIAYAHQYLNEDLSGAFVLIFALGPLAIWFMWYRLAAGSQSRDIANAHLQ